MQRRSLPVFVVLLVSASYATPAQLNSGVSVLPLSHNKRMQIVGGTAADIKDYGHQISWFHDGFHRCGGSIISPEWVVTAAHCTIGAHTSASEIYAGTSIISPKGIQKAQVAKIVSIHTHPRFDIKVYDHDIALLKVAPPFTFDNVTHAIPIVDMGSSPYTNESVTVTGWGLLKENSNYHTPVLQKVKVVVHDYWSCKTKYMEAYWNLPDTLMCASAERKDACQGDSGGPLIYNWPEDNKDRLVGLVSAGIGCANKDFPGLYTDLRHPDMRNFITDVTGIKLSHPVSILVR